MDCGNYYIKQSEHIEEDIDDEIESINFTEVINTDFETVKCDECGGYNLKKLSYKDIFWFIPICRLGGRLKIKCPKCRKALRFEGSIIFDD